MSEPSNVEYLNQMDDDYYRNEWKKLAKLRALVSTQECSNCRNKFPETDCQQCGLCDRYACIGCVADNALVRVPLRTPNRGLVCCFNDAFNGFSKFEESIFFHFPESLQRVSESGDVLPSGAQSLTWSKHIEAPGLVAQMSLYCTGITAEAFETPNSCLDIYFTDTPVAHISIVDNRVYHKIDGDQDVVSPFSLNMVEAIGVYADRTPVLKARLTPMVWAILRFFFAEIKRYRECKCVYDEGQQDSSMAEDD